ncbi:MAG: hypothetical protein AAJB65_00695 [Candidatus Hodgkinia cicadicola]
MNQLVLLPRPRRGSKACKLLRASGFVPGVVKIGNNITAVSVCAKSIRRLSYKQTTYATLNNKIVALALTRYQLDPVSFEIQHIEYTECQRALANTATRILVFKSANCAIVRSGAKPKTLHTVLNIIGEASLAPNYIKINISEYVKGENVIITRLRCKCIQFATTEPDCVLVAIC